jgi:hypothetical protein
MGPGFPGQGFGYPSRALSTGPCFTAYFRVFWVSLYPGPSFALPGWGWCFWILARPAESGAIVCSIECFLSIL